MKYGLGIVFCCLTLFAFAQTETDLLTQYAGQINRVETLQSNFSEEKHLLILDQPIESTGQLSFDKNAQKLYWQYLTPFQNGFLIEKEQVYRLQGKNKAPVQNAMGRMMAAQMVVWLTLDFNSLKRDYEITVNGRELTFTPRNKAHKVVKQITVWLDDKNPQIVKQVRMDEPGGDYIVWTFTQVRLNVPPAQGDA